MLLDDLGTPVDIIARQPEDLKVHPSANHVIYDIITKGIIAYERTSRGGSMIRYRPAKTFQI